MDFLLDFVGDILGHANPYHLAIEALMGAVLLWFFLKNPKSAKEAEKLSPREEEQLLREWKSEPLVPPTEEHHVDELLNTPVVERATSTTITVSGQELLNFASYNMLGFAGHPKVMSESEKAIRHYGVGSCGPRGFYGSLDVHLGLEQKIAKFMGVEDCILYSSAYACLSSAITAFAKRSDWLVVDKTVNHALQTGVALSRSHVKYFDHNNYEQLEQQLAEVAKANAKKVSRRFLVIEALSQNFGDILDLPRVLALIKKYKFRIILDESNSFGVLGKTGRGITEHYNIPITEIDINLISLERVIASSGGVCLGTKVVVGHQRLGGSGYVFSAASPPFTSVAGITALDILDSQGENLLGELRKRVAFVRKELSQLPQFILQGDALSPIQHLRLAVNGERIADELYLESLCTAAKQHGVFLTRAKYAQNELSLPPPSLRLTIGAQFTMEQIQKLCQTVKLVASAKRS